MMQQSDVGYELCEQDGEDVPYCPHGPTLLFSRKIDKGDAIDKFYACAAYRKRKDCNFYQKFGPKESEEKQALRKKIYLDFNSSNRLYRNIMEASIHKERIKFCLICGVVIPNKLCADNSHTAQYKFLSATDLKYPSRFLTPKESNASNAQYFFSTDVIDFISSTILTLHFDKVLCIGTPSIHEHIKHSGKHKSVSTFLLDLDVRMRQFHKDYAHYNMFNHHFYEAAEEERFHQFMASSKSLLIIIDPPYGGLVQALSVTLKKIVSTSSCKSVSRLLFFPYFMEPQVEKHLPSLAMSDYKVNYSNHSGYKAGVSEHSKGSPARIYTDIPLKRFVLPQEHGYKFCEVCLKYISKENQHCYQCGSCTTKHGPQYHHCETCKRCVKPSRVHCLQCDQCEMERHMCHSTETKQTGILLKRKQMSKRKHSYNTAGHKKESWNVKKRHKT